MAYASKQEVLVDYTDPNNIIDNKDFSVLTNDDNVVLDINGTGFDITLQGRIQEDTSNPNNGYKDIFLVDLCKGKKLLNVTESTLAVMDVRFLESIRVNVKTQGTNLKVTARMSKGQ